MTDKKISQLTAAGSVNDADIFPMVQSGDTKYATIAQMKAAVAPSAASESTAGIIEIANQAEAESQTNDDKAMTALKVQQFLDVGTVIDGATGGNQGDGTINAKGLFVNGEEVGGSASGVTLISSSTPTGVPTVTFSSIPQTYRGLLLMIEGISCSSATRHFYAYCQTNAAASGLQPVGFQVNAGTTANLVPSGSYNIFGTPATQAAANTFEASFRIMNYIALNTQATIHPRPYEAEYQANGSQLIIRGHLNGAFTTADTGIDTIVCGWNSTGNFDAGTIKLYGIK